MVSPMAMTCLCRDCAVAQPTLSVGQRRDGRCRRCGSPRLVTHAELEDLCIAHLDCDAFYASIEKRDHPEWRDAPVIVGGGHRGVVAACCYIARLYGVRSAMPMFKALSLCPQAIVVAPDMAKYVAAGRRIRAMMRALTPLTEPLSIDEAFLDLTGTQALHGGSPAQSLIRLVLAIEREIGVTASIGLSHNKFMAKIASDLDKPRGFAVIGKAETLEFLAQRPVEMIWGVGPRLAARLKADGIFKIGQLRDQPLRLLIARYGSIGLRLSSFSRGEDRRPVTPHSPTRSVSCETTFDFDLREADHLEAALWPLAEKVAQRLKAADLAGRTVTLKLKTAAFKTIGRSRRLPSATRLAQRIFDVARLLLAAEVDGRAFRLLGVGVSDMVAGRDADQPDLAEPDLARQARVEMAMDAVRTKLGPQAVVKGRSMRGVGVGKRKSDG
jgi:DNA polymerase IV